MTDSTTAAEIAAGLTQAQREALLEPRWIYPGGQEPIALVDCKSDLIGHLAVAMTMQTDRLTPIGLEVRAILLQQKGDE